MPRQQETSKNRRRPVNLSVRQDVMEQAKALGINVSQVAESALAREIRRIQEAQWLEENADAIEEYNQRVDEKGMYIEDLRRF